MNYCLNDSCPEPVNEIQAQICKACGSKLLLGDRYQILRYIGKGGFGKTFLAADISSPEQSLCVIKQLLAKRRQSTMGRELFNREANILREIGHHPQIPRLIDYFTVQEQFYLVQEYIYGQTLKQEVIRAGALDEKQTKQALKEILLILQEVHRKNIIHRDIKPSNIIRRQRDRKLILIDFGLVEAFTDQIAIDNTNNQERNLSEYSVGSHGFTAPEQYALRPTFASDIYSLGVTCMYLMQVKTPEKIGIDLNTGEIMWFKDLKISEYFSNILLKMLDVSVENRFQNVAEILDILNIKY